MLTVLINLIPAITALCLGLSGATATAQARTSAVVTTLQVRAELMAHAPQGIQSGQPLWLGLQLTHQPGWHTYWQNPGDSGLATQLDWQLPEGMQAGGILWPTPHMIPVANMVNHGFEDTVLLAVPVHIAKSYKAVNNEIRLQANWLVCKQECIPQSGQFVLQLPAQTSIADHTQRFETLIQSQPQPLSPPIQIARLNGQGLQMAVQGLPAHMQGHALKAYAQLPEVLGSGLGMNGEGKWENGVWQMSAPLHRMRSTEPKQLGLWLVDDSQSPARTWQVTLEITGRWPTDIPATASTPTTSPQLAGSSAQPASLAGLLSALIGAFVGGLLLNLMPCVLPVLAIKVLSLSQSSVSPTQRRGIGSAYAIGVLVSMLTLALLVIGLRAAGSKLGWGFQLQSPGLVAGLSLLFTLIALNLAGVLELRGYWTSSLAMQMARHPLADAFLSGVLAVVVAAPCTAPFMGASVGVAFTLPAWQAMLIFAMLGSGLALPFTLMAWVPQTARWLPRPGAWMQVLRQALAFPMWLTVVWLLWVLSKQTSADAASWWLAALVLMSGLVWASTMPRLTRYWLSGFFVVCLTALAWLSQPVLQQASDTQNLTADRDKPWQAWSEAKVQAALQKGQPVFIDFTAAWCVTCQVNKQSTLRNEKVIQAFAQRNVLLLQADWTRQDPSISQALAALGRSGVPVYVLHVPDKPPQVLSELLSPDLVLRTLQKLGSGSN